MWRAWVLLVGCGFTPGVLPSDATASADRDMCTPAWSLPYAHRFPIEAGGALVGYTLRIDASAAIALAQPSGDDLRVFADETELDRLITSPLVELRIPASGALHLYVGNPAATAPPANPANVYLFAETFDSLPVGDHASAAFVPLPEPDWNVVDDGGNHVYRAAGSVRHPAAIRGLTLADGDIRARIRLNAGGGQQHNGLAARGNSMVAATMDGFVGQLMGDSDRERIAEYTNGASPPLELVGMTRTIVRGTWHRMRLRYVGDLIELFVDETLVLTTTRAGSDGQLVGLFAHDCNVDYDDVTVRMAASPEPVAQLGAREDRCP